jgi:DNA-binding beta-propeller fold protein YncE
MSRFAATFSFSSPRCGDKRLPLRLLLAISLLAPHLPLRASEDEEARVKVQRRSSLSTKSNLKHAYPIALDEDGRRLFIGGYESDNILVWDLDGRAVLHEAKNVRQPFFLKYHPVKRNLVALAYDDSGNSVLVFDRFLNELRRIALGSYAYSLALTEDGGTAYVGIFGQIVSVNLETGAKTALATLPSYYYYPTGLCLDVDRNRLIVVSLGWFLVDGQWVIRTQVNALDLAGAAFTESLVLGDGLFSWDAVLDRDELFIANTDDNSMHLVDVATFQVAAKIEGVSCPQRLILHPGRKWIYVIDNYLDRFHVIDRIHRTLVKTIYPGDDPSGIAFDSKGRVYTANLWSSDFTVIDAETEEVVERISLSGASPHSLFYEPKDRRLYVTNGSSNGIQILDADTGKVIDMLTMPDGAYGGPLVVDPNRQRVYVADDWRGGLAVYPTDSGQVQFQTNHAEIKLIALPGSHPSGVAEAPRNTLAVPFVSGGRLKLALVNKVAEELDDVIDLGEGLQTGGVAVDARKNRAYVADYSGGRVISVDLKNKTVLDAVYVERKPGAIAVHPESGYIYVCNPGSNSVAVLADEPFETLGFVDVGEGPASVAFAPSKARIYVVNSGDGTLTVINELEHRVVETLSVADDLLAVVVDPDSETIFVASPSSGEVLTVQDSFRLSPGRITKTLADASFGLRNAYAYPNPAQGVSPVFRVEVGAADRLLLQVFDVSGSLVHEASLDRPPELVGNAYVYEYRWDASAVASGVYLVSVRAQKAGQDDIRTTFRTAVVK